MKRVRDFLASKNYPRGELYDLPSSAKRFPDGAQYRIEIPSVEGPRALAAVLEAAERHGVTIHRISQGSGIWMLTDEEIREMCRLGAEAGIEVSLFVGPRAAWGTSAQVRASAGKNLGARLRGIDEVVYATEDVIRGCELGLRSVLVADEGQLWLVNEMKKAGESASQSSRQDFGCRKWAPLTRLQSGCCATRRISTRAAFILKIWRSSWRRSAYTGRRSWNITYNVPTDLTLPQIAAIRAAVDLPLDMYVEVRDRQMTLAVLCGIIDRAKTRASARVEPGVYGDRQCRS